MPDDQDKKKHGLGGLFDHINDLLDVVADLQDGGEINRTGELKSRSGKVSGMYGLRIRSGIEGERPTVFEPFGDVKSRPGRTATHDEREPVVDLFEEDDRITIVAELPGVQSDNIEVAVENGRTLILKASNRDRKYRKELTLSRQVNEKPLQCSYLNGILSVVLQKETNPALT
jgi:HSP20 family protein